MEIIASSIQETANTFLHAGYGSAAAFTNLACAQALAILIAVIFAIRAFIGWTRDYS